ncbi:hypothetical protein [Nakamurella deserti]|nr:hypothetical protein [Nakamurella deserti]
MARTTDNAVWRAPRPLERPAPTASQRICPDAVTVIGGRGRFPPA